MINRTTNKINTDELAKNNTVSDVPFSLSFNVGASMNRVILIVMFTIFLVNLSDGQVIWVPKSSTSIFDVQNKRTDRKTVKQTNDSTITKEPSPFWNDPHNKAQMTTKFWKLTANTCRLNKEVWAYDSKWIPDDSMSGLREKMEQLCEMLLEISENFENGMSPNLEPIREYINKIRTIFTSTVRSSQDKRLSIIRRNFEHKVQNYFTTQILQVNY